MRLPGDPYLCPIGGVSFGGVSLRKVSPPPPFPHSVEAAPRRCRKLVVICFAHSSFASGHTALNTPDPIRTRKLSSARPGQYWGGGPPGKSLGCCWLFPVPCTSGIHEPSRPRVQRVLTRHESRRPRMRLPARRRMRRPRRPKASVLP